MFACVVCSMSNSSASSAAAEREDDEDWVEEVFEDEELVPTFAALG